MTVRLIAAACAAALLVMPDAVHAQAASGERSYVQVDFGGSFLRDTEISDGVELAGATFGEAAVFGGAFGQHVHKRFRVEGNLSYRKAEVDSVRVAGFVSPGVAEVEALAGMANGYLDLMPGGRISPYLGAGVGAVRLAVQSTSASPIPVSGSDTVLAWNLMVGATVPIVNNLGVALGYRYLSTTDATFRAGLDGQTNDVEANLSGHEVIASFRYHF